MHSDWLRKMYDLPYSISKCRQGLRSVSDRALVWEDVVSTSQANWPCGTGRGLLFEDLVSFIYEKIKSFLLKLPVILCLAKLLVHTVWGNVLPFIVEMREQNSHIAPYSFKSKNVNFLATEENRKPTYPQPLGSC